MPKKMLSNETALRLSCSGDTTRQLAQMIDVSAVRAECHWEDVRKTLEIALRYQCIAVFALPGLTPFLKDQMEQASRSSSFLPKLGGTVGFPGGGETTSMKVQQTRELIGMGCDEVDMVMNIGFMKSGWHDRVKNDIVAVKQACGNIPLKVILECHYLGNDEICKASELAVAAGADWVKTGTGWAPTGATLENVALMKKTVGNNAKVKAAGGVKSLHMVMQMIELGVERFGIGAKTVVYLFDELNQNEKTLNRPDENYGVNY